MPQTTLGHLSDLRVADKQERVHVLQRMRIRNVGSLHSLVPKPKSRKSTPQKDLQRTLKLKKHPSQSL